MKTIDCLGYSIYTGEITTDILSYDKLIINTINPHSYCVAKKDNYYSQALHTSDILLPDGVGIIWAIKILKGQKSKRFTGSDVHIEILKLINKTGGKVFYLGSSNETLQKIQERIKIEYPNITVETYSPPYKSNFTEAENDQILTAINKFKPDVLFVGMTAPKQEKWLYQHKDQISAKIASSIGAVFDFYAGTIKRPGKFWIFLGLEWLPRLLREPKRLWRRNLISAPQFIYDVFIMKINKKKEF